jgi:hypothetical protein
VSGTEQLLYLVVVPAVAIAIIWALASIGGPRSKKRYRPGRPYDFVPVWYVANHHREPGAEKAARAELTAGAGNPEAGSTLRGTTGGASDRW